MKKISLVAAALISTFSFNVFAADLNSEAKAIESSIKLYNPDAPAVKSISKSPVNGIYEVTTQSNEVFYATPDGKFILTGELLELSKNGGINHTAQKIDQLNKFSIKDLQLSDAIVQKKGTGKDIIVTFEDPNCTFCRKLQPELEKLDNVTIYTFIIPILGAPSLEAAKSIWCSSDKVKAWNEYMVSKKMPNIDQAKIASCDITALKRNSVFAREHNITGTPAIFLPSGKKFNGYVDATTIRQSLGK